MRRLFTAVLLISISLLSAAPARSYTLQSTDGSSSAKVKWPTRRITITVSSSLFTPPANFKPGSDVVGAVRRALAHWSEAANIQFILNYSKAESISAQGSGGDGASLITIAHTPENSAPFNSAGNDAAGRTRIFYTESGAITEADITLNPAQQFSTDGSTGTYDLEAALTHEIGHLLGLEHSGVTGATMQPRQGKNGLYNTNAWTPRTLSDDDRAGVRSLYGTRGKSDQARNSVTGTISYPGGAPAYGAHVWAEDVETGKVSAGNITLANGTYRIEGLPAGSYRLLVEALDGTVPAAEIASGRGSYAGLAVNPLPPFRTQEIGSVKLSAGTTAQLSAQLSSLPVLLNPAFIGINEQLSTIAVPLVAGRTYTIYLGGDGINTNQISAAGIIVASPFISINPSSLAQHEFAGGLPVISFDVTIRPDTPTGDYSVRLNSSTGEVACLAGGLSIEGVDAIAEDSGRLTITPVDAPGVDDTALLAGDAVLLSGAEFSIERASTDNSKLKSAALSHSTLTGAAAVNLIYASGSSEYVPLTQISGTHLGFRVPSHAEPGRALVEVYVNGQKTDSAAIEISDAGTIVSARGGGDFVECEGVKLASAPKPGTEE